MHRYVKEMEDIAPNQTQSLSLSHVAKFRRGLSLPLSLSIEHLVRCQKERERKKTLVLSLMREYQTLLPLHFSDNNLRKKGEVEREGGRGSTLSLTISVSTMVHQASVFSQQ